MIWLCTMQFFIGVFVGSALTVVALALVSIARHTDRDIERLVEEKRKEKEGSK